MIIQGEALSDSSSGKWYFIIQSDDGKVFEKSAPVFDNQHEAEQAMVELLNDLQALSKQN